jgi:hypothetical protein
MASIGGSKAKLETSKSGIPKAPFIHDVEAHLGGAEEDAEPHLRTFQETMSRYKMMEVDRQQRKRALEEKIPEMKKTLAMVHHLKEKRVSVSSYLGVSLLFDIMLITPTKRGTTAGRLRDDGNTL